jgi:hypothetical protein
MNLFSRVPPLQVEITTWRATSYPPPDGQGIVLNGVVFSSTDSGLMNSPVDNDSTILQIIIPIGTRVLLWNETDEQEVLINHGTVANVATMDYTYDVYNTGDIAHPVKKVHLTSVP